MKKKSLSSQLLLTVHDLNSRYPSIITAGMEYGLEKLFLQRGTKLSKTVNQEHLPFTPYEQE